MTRATSHGSSGLCPRHSGRKTAPHPMNDGIHPPNNTPHWSSLNPHVSDTDEASLGHYCEGVFATSGISGVSHIAASRTWFRRIFWTVVFFSCLTGFLYQSVSTLLQYFEYPTIVEVLVLNDGALEFPSVTVCNNNRIRKSRYCEIYSERDECRKRNFENLSEKEIFNVQLDLLKRNISKSRKDIGHQRKDIFLLCMFKGIPPLLGEECISRFHYFYDPFFGNCYSFNGTNSDGSKLEAIESDVWQGVSDLKLVLNAETAEYLESNRDPGIVITFHPSTVYPDPFSEGVRVRPGHSYNFALQKTAIELLTLPYKTNCTDYNLLKFSKIVGQRTLSTRICTAQCSQNMQLKKCSYVTPKVSLYFDYLPKEFPTKESSWKLKCAEKESNRTKQLCRSACRVPCRQTTYHVTIDSYAWFKRTTSVNIEGLHKWENKTWNETVQNLAQVRVYFTTMQQTIYKHVPKLEVLELFGRIGGYIGIWLGISLLAVCEFCEKSLMVITFKCRKASKKGWCFCPGEQI